MEEVGSRKKRVHKYESHRIYRNRSYSQNSEKANVTEGKIPVDEAGEAGKGQTPRARPHKPKFLSSMLLAII
jgi:hypothetical protein